MRRLIAILLVSQALAAQAEDSGLFLNINANQCTGGTTLSGLVALQNPAPPSGVVVQLQAGPGVCVPPTVTIPPGANSAPFTVSTFASQVPESVRIAATYGSAQKVAYLQILATPAPPPQAQGYAGPSGHSNDPQAGWNAGAEATADLQAEQSWNYAAPYSPYGAGYGGMWGAGAMHPYGAARGYGMPMGGAYRR